MFKNLLEAQFEQNQKFQERIRAEIPEEDLRRQCYGRDRNGLCYWFIQVQALLLVHPGTSYVVGIFRYKLTIVYKLCSLL